MRTLGEWSADNFHISYILWRYMKQLSTILHNWVIIYHCNCMVRSLDWHGPNLGPNFLCLVKLQDIIIDGVSAAIPVTNAPCSASAACVVYKPCLYIEYLPVTNILLSIVVALRICLGEGRGPELIQEVAPWTSSSVVSLDKKDSNIPPVTK